MRYVTIFLGVVILFVALIVIVPAVRSAAYNSPYETAILKQINIARVNHGKKPVKPGWCIDRQAEHWARHLKDTNSFYHQDLGRIFGNCGGIHVGEIMGRGDVSPKRFKRMWLNSPEHRTIMLGRFDKAGVGVVDSRLGKIVVVDFIEY